MSWLLIEVRLFFLVLTVHTFSDPNIVLLGGIFIWTLYGWFKNFFVEMFLGQGDGDREDQSGRGGEGEDQSERDGEG